MSVVLPQSNVPTRLSKVGTSTISNVLLTLGFRNTCLRGLSPIDPSRERMVGPAYTLRFIPAREDLDDLDNYCSDDNLHRRAIEECPAGAVLVIDAGGSRRASSAGDLMAARLKARGVAGMVTDGGFRDTAGIRQTGLPAFQSGQATPATVIALHPIELNVPIGCAGVPIYPGDIIVGDGDGVVAIPAHLADKVAASAHATADYEEFVGHELSKGRSLLGLFPATAESTQEFEAWVAAGKPRE